MNNFRDFQTRTLHNVFKVYFMFLIFIVAFVGCSIELDVDDFEFNSCTSNCVYLDGRVLDAKTMEPLEMTTIKLGYQQFGSFGWLVSTPTKYYEIGSETSNDNGSYNLNFRAGSISSNSNGYFNQNISKEGYFNNNYKFYNSDLEVDTVINDLYYMVPRGELKVDILNKNPKDSLDRFDAVFSCPCSSYLDSFPFRQFEDVFRSSETERFFGDVDTTLTFPFPSGEMIKIKYKSIKKGIEREYSDSIILNGDEPFHYSIEY